MDVLGDLVKASLGPLPTVCQEQVLLDMERARMQAEDNRAALIRTDKKRKRLEDQKEQALLHCRETRDSLEHVLSSSDALTLYDANQQQEFAISVSINSLQDTILDMESDSDT